jgi:hypothetical protein
MIELTQREAELGVAIAMALLHRLHTAQFHVDTAGNGLDSLLRQSISDWIRDIQSKLPPFDVN